MDYRSLIAILGILRLFRTTGPGHAAFDVIKSKLGDHTEEAAAYRICANVVELTEIAAATITNSDLDEEAQAGILASIEGLKRAFSINGVASAWQSQLPDINGSISSLVILLSAMKISPNLETPAEAVDLANEVDELIATIEGAGLDPVTANIARRHLTMLATLLRHIPVFGLEAALLTYFELMMAMNNSMGRSREPQTEEAAGFWEVLKSWKDRFSDIEELWNKGTKALANPVVQNLLSTSF